MVRNKPGELTFVVPDSLVPGSCRAKVRALFGTDDVREGTLKAVLDVQAMP
jgi:hypothetical protein